MLSPSRSVTRTALALTFALSGVLALSSCASAPTAPQASTAASTTSAVVSSDALLDAVSTTILNQQIVYPNATQAEVSSSIITLPPGVETGLHQHNAPMYAYIMEGELTVEYEGGITKVYAPGEAIMEAFETPHNGKNAGDTDVRVLVVNIGADGVENSVKLP